MFLVNITILSLYYYYYYYDYNYILIYYYEVAAGRAAAGRRLVRHCRAPLGDLPLQPVLRRKRRDPIPKDNSLIRKETSSYKGFHSTFAALSSC